MKRMKHVLIVLFCLLAPTTWAANLSPADSYLAFTRALQNANNLSEIDRYFLKRAVETRNKIIESLPDDGGRTLISQRILGQLKSSFGEARIKAAREDTSRARGKSSVGNETAVVMLDGVDAKTGAPIDRWPIMEMEQGVWKFTGSVSVPNPSGVSVGKDGKLAAMPARTSGNVVVEPLPPERGNRDTR